MIIKECNVQVLNETASHIVVKSYNSSEGVYICDLVKDYQFVDEVYTYTVLARDRYYFPENMPCAITPAELETEDEF